MSEEVLEIELLSGNLSAFDEIYRRHYRAMLGIALGLVKDSAIAKDVTQDVFCKFYERVCENKIVSQNSQLIVKSVLSRMIHNACIDVFRMRKRTSVVATENDEHLELLMFSCGEEYFDPSKMELDEKSEIHKEIANAVLKLPEEQQLVIKLRLENGLSFIEISELEGESINTWLGRMRYALINLRKMLDIKVKTQNND